MYRQELDAMAGRDQEASTAILTPHMPAMIAAETRALSATPAPQRRFAARRSTPCAISTTRNPDARWLRTKNAPSA
jgi:hypothetical protein